MPRYQGVFMVKRAVLRSLSLETTGRGWGVVMEMVLRVKKGGRVRFEEARAFRIK